MQTAPLQAVDPRTLLHQIVTREMNSVKITGPNSTPPSKQVRDINEPAKVKGQ